MFFFSDIMDCLITGVRIRTQRRVHKRSTLHKEVPAAVLSDSRKYIPIVSNLNIITVCPDINSSKITVFILVVCATENKYRGQVLSSTNSRLPLLFYITYFCITLKIHLTRFMIHLNSQYKSQ